MICPSCNVKLEGGLIYDTYLGQYCDETKALKTAALYGATKTEGRWGRQIAIYDRELDRTVAYRCPDCGHEWNRL